MTYSMDYITVSAKIRMAFMTRDWQLIKSLLADDVHWGDNSSANKCRSSREVIDRFRTAISNGIEAEIVEVIPVPAGILCQFRVLNFGSPQTREPRELYHLYRLSQGRIFQICPFDDREQAINAGNLN